MQQIYRGTPMSKGDFNKVAKSILSVIKVEVYKFQKLH